MTLPTLSSRARAVAAGIAVALLAGCATAPSSAPPERQVRERATQRWSALIGGDMEKAFAYMPPSYRSTTTVERYRRTFQGAVKWTGAEVAWVKCESDDKCTAHMKVDAQVMSMRGSPAISNYFDEIWIREDAQWWLFPTP